MERYLLYLAIAIIVGSSIGVIFYLRRASKHLKDVLLKLEFFEKNIDETASKLTELQNQQYTDIITNMQKFQEEMQIRESENEDEWYEIAKDIVKERGVCSTSLLQRRLKIGYVRAARLIDMLEDDGLVEPADGAKPRRYIGQDDEE